jgi:hypothetical protein
MRLTQLSFSLSACGVPYRLAPAGAFRRREVENSNAVSPALALVYACACHWGVFDGDPCLREGGHMDFRYLAGTFLGGAMIAVPFSLRLAGSLAGACLVCAVIREYRDKRARRVAQRDSGSSDEIRVGQ